ncbi:MAG: hypothetical protein E6G16_02670 [Actinobacteria bacterium]|nr:MAG: hypothetical protein E6G16_02670 [Actinomycetota bacterium]
MRRLILFALAFTAAAVLVPTVAVADSATHTYLLEMGEPNLGVAANGDQIAITGSGEFSVNPNAVDAAGEFTHTDSSGNVLATGTWAATGLINYQSYGCGEVFGTPIPPELCGGAVKMSVTLTPTGTSLRLPGTLTVFCVIGTHAPQSVLGPLTEGVTLNVPGIQNFNHSAGGDNDYVQIS